MEDKRIWLLCVIILVIGMAFTIGHLAYIVYAYQHASIIYFIATELW